MKGNIIVVVVNKEVNKSFHSYISSIGVLGDEMKTSNRELVCSSFKVWYSTRIYIGMTKGRVNE